MGQEMLTYGVEPSMTMPYNFSFLIKEKKILVTYNYPQNTLPKTTAFSHIYIFTCFPEGKSMTYINPTQT